MKPGPKQTVPFLDENGVVITRTHLTTPSHTIALARLNNVRITRENRLMALVSRHKPSFRLVVATAATEVPFVVFETEDAQFMRRIEVAI